MRRRQIRLGRADRGQVPRGVPAPDGDRPRGDAAQDGPAALAGSQGEAGGALQAQDPRRMVPPPRRQRRLLRAGAVARRGAKPSAPLGAAKLRRGRRNRAAGAGAALQPHARRPADAAGDTGRARHRLAGAMWLAPRRDRRAEALRRARLTLMHHPVGETSPMTALTLAQASLIVDKALEHGRALKLKPLAVAVLDAGGHLLAFKREDGASILRPQIAHGKAWGLLRIGFGGRELARPAAPSPAF